MKRNQLTLVACRPPPRYFHDLIYVSVFIQAAGCLTDWAWLVGLAVPAYAFYMLWIKVLWPYFSSEPQAPGRTLDAATQRRLDKSEKRAEARRAKAMRR